MNQHARAERDALTAGRDLIVNLEGSVELPHEAVRLVRDHVQGNAWSSGRPIFVQYLNPEILGCYGVGASKLPGISLPDALHATRIAVLSTEQYLVFPASYFVEVAMMPEFLAEVMDLVREGLVRYCSYTSDLDAYCEQKIAEYRADARNPYREFRQAAVDGIAWTPRFSSSTATDIAEEWRRDLRPGGFLAPVVRGLNDRQRRKRGAEKSLAAVPERLAGQAFIGRFVSDVIPQRLRADEIARMNMFISRAYLLSYLLDLDANLLAHFSYGDLTCGVERLGEDLQRRVLSARRFDLVLTWLGLYDFVHHYGNWTDLIALRSTPEFASIVAVAHHCPREPLRRIATSVRRTSRMEVATTFYEALSRAAGVATEIHRDHHFS